MEKKEIVELNIAALTALVRDSKTPAKVRVSASETLLLWLEKRSGLEWGLDL